MVFPGKGFSEIDITQKASLISSESPSVTGEKMWEEEFHTNPSWIYRNFWIWLWGLKIGTFCPEDGSA